MKKVLPIFLFLTIAIAQLGAIRIQPAVVIYSHDVAILLLAIYALFHLPKKIPRPTLLSPIGAFVVICVWSLLINVHRFAFPDIVSSGLYAIRWAGYAVIYLLVLLWPVAPMFWLWGLWGTGVCMSVLGLAQYVLYPSLGNLYYLGWDPHLYRVFSTLLDPNFASMVFVCTLILGVYLWKEAKFKWVIGGAQGVTLIALLLTYSRSGYLAFAMAAGVALLLYKQTRLVLVGMTLFLAVLFILPKPGGEGVQLLRTASTLARVGNWQRGMTLIREQPLFGHGFNTLRYVQRTRGWTDESRVVSHAAAGIDNSLQFVWATTGIVGLGIYLWLLASCVSLGWKIQRTKRWSSLGFVVIASFTSVIIHSQFSNSLFYPIVMMWLWILLGSAERLLSSDK